MVTEKLQTKIAKVVIKQMYDNDSETAYLEQEEFEGRLKDFDNGDFFFIGIRADAEIRTSYNGNDWLINTITSGGIWGIESDSCESYLESVRMEQEGELKDVLFTLGFTEDEIVRALDESEMVTDY